MTELRNARHLSVHDLRRRINEGDVDTVVVAFADVQGRLQGKRVQATHFAEHVLDQGTAGPAYLLAVDVDMNGADHFGFFPGGQGYGEMTLVLDLQTIRLLKHQPGAVMVQCDVRWPDETPVVQAPRTILNQQLRAAASRGYAVLASTELEFMAFHSSYEDAWNAHYRDLAAASQYNVDFSIMSGSRIEPLLQAIRSSAYAAGIDVESINARRSLGQHEISLSHQDAITTADNHAVFKTMAKEIAAQHGKSITFMAKYDEQQGNSCRIQLSLRGDDGSTAFWNDPGRTALHDSFVAGVLATMYDFTLLYAPTINSYKRFVEGSVAPTTIAWGPDNSASAIRLVDRESTARVENRVPGGDVNPYLALAAMIAGGLHGIENDLELGDPLVGNAYTSSLPKVPHTMPEAKELFGSSEIVRSALAAEVVDHYVNMADVELEAFDAAVTDWELARTFERM